LNAAVRRAVSLLPAALPTVRVAMIDLMLGKTTLPERAVDTWVAAYLASELPGVWLWAPTQRTKVDFDISISGSGKLFVLEQKAPVLHKTRSEHWVVVDIGLTGQLWRYCTDPRLAGLVWYVIPHPPYPALAAAGRGSSLMPTFARSRVAGHRWPPGLPCEDWFHVVPARDLYEWLQLLPGWGHMPPLPRIVDPPVQPPEGLVGRRSFACADLVSGPPANAMTLRQWVASVKNCNVEGGRVENGRITRIGRLVQAGRDGDRGRDVNIPLNDDDDKQRRDADGSAARAGSAGSTRAVFVPSSAIPAWR
jgi:hypothetical protein